jgi:hypothetical protein
MSLLILYVQKAAAAQLFEEAQDRLNYDDYEAAIRYMQQAAALDPNVRLKSCSVYGTHTMQGAQ